MENDRRHHRAHRRARLRVVHRVLGHQDRPAGEGRRGGAARPLPPHPTITEDNLVVGIDTVIYFTVTDAKAATYEVANPLQAIEQLTVTTLRNVIGGMTLEDTLTSRDNVNTQLRIVLDEATGKWGIRINRVELKSVNPPPTIQEV